MEQVVNWINGVVWSNALVFFCLGVGIFYSIVTRFTQIRNLKHMFQLLFKDKASEEGVSSFQAFNLSLGNKIGVGNIAGVATAIAFGGPGAVFWIWVMAFLGASTAFIETTLGQVYKTKEGSQYRGGASYYIEKGLNLKWCAVIFAIIFAVATGLFLPGAQANTISTALEYAFGIHPAFSGIGLVIILGIIIFGAVTRIARTAEILVPFMAIAYILMSLFIVFSNLSELPDVISLIFSSAFGTHAVFGGLVGSAISFGVMRGVYSNAAGTGMDTYASGAAEVSHPAKQGLVQSFSVYVDTLLVCSATAFMILITGMYNVTPEGSEPLVMNLTNTEAGTLYTQQAVESVIPGFGAAFVAVTLLFFAFTTLLAFYYMAETNLVYIGRKIKTSWLIMGLKIGFLASVYFSSINTAQIAWAIGDIGLGSIAWLNLFFILFLTKPALKVLKDYEVQHKEGKTPVFNPRKLGIKNAEFWEEKYNNITKHKEERDSEDVI
ncbi:alanine/glycine:cation symporter family protein [Peribacillus asahii]|uniref:alanine/glycine:cation symporter family protein n=1 Tax=Peribacillus asahii TaxID=228899 RepID=UPI0037F75D32